MAEVHLDDVVKSYGSVRAVDFLNLVVKEGEFLTLLGPSGCGKTTALRMVAGLISPSSGCIRIGGKDVTDVPPYRRSTGMVFQSYALFPHMSVSDNVAFGLKVRRMRRSDARARVLEALKLVQLEEFADRHPRQLSGGQQQRVALARAVVIQPQVLLLDEPLGALDLKLRHELQIQIKQVQETLGITALYVTHDQGEALSMSDRVAVMRSGRVLQLAEPAALYEHPNSIFVANFVGRTNLLEVDVVSRSEDGKRFVVRARKDGGHTFDVSTLRDDDWVDIGSPCLLGFRPEHANFQTGSTNRLRARVDKVSYYGSTWSVWLTSALGTPIEVEVAAGGQVPRMGEELEIHWSPDHCFLLGWPD